MTLRNCHDCAAVPGEMHTPGCDVERCPRCGCQIISCDCIYEVCGIDVDNMEETHPDVYNHGPTDDVLATWEKEWGHRRMPWTGVWPGDARCRELGWFVRWTDDGWQTCEGSHPEAQADLNRLVMMCDWDSEKQEWFPRV